MNLGDDLMRQVKAYASKHDRTVTSVMEEALRRLLAEKESARAHGRVALPVSRQRAGLVPGVDLERMSTLLDVLDGDGVSGLPRDAAS